MNKIENSKLISEFEILEGIPYNKSDEKALAKFERFVERREKENEEDLNNKDNWEFERSSGYAGYRNEVTGDWIYENEYLTKFGEKENKQQGKELTTEEVMEGRSLAYNFLDFKDSPEKETLEKIKFVLSANNESQAIRFIEQYGEWVKENCRKEFKTEINKIRINNEDTNSWGDGFEYAVQEVNKYLKNN